MANDGQQPVLIKSDRMERDTTDRNHSNNNSSGEEEKAINSSGNQFWPTTTAAATAHPPHACHHSHCHLPLLPSNAAVATATAGGAPPPRCCCCRPAVSNSSSPTRTTTTPFPIKSSSFSSSASSSASFSSNSSNNIVDQQPVASTTEKENHHRRPRSRLCPLLFNSSSTSRTRRRLLLPSSFFLWPPSSSSTLLSPVVSAPHSNSLPPSPPSPPLNCQHHWHRWHSQQPNNRRHPTTPMCMFSGLFERTNALLGLFISKHPWWHVLFSLAVVLSLSMHLINMHIEYDIKASFSPENSKSMREERIYKEFYNLSTTPQRAFLLFTAKDGGTMLREEQLRDVLELDMELSQEMEKRDSGTGMRGCDPFCQLNRPFHLIAQWILDHINGSSSDAAAPASSHATKQQRQQFRLDYPVSSYMGNNLFVGGNLFGIRRTNENNNNGNNLLFVRTIILWYFNRADTPETKQRLRHATLQLFEQAQRGERLRHVDFQIFGDEIANSEMIRGAIQATILMTIGFVLLLLFVTIVVHRKMRELVTVPGVLCIVLVSVLCPLLSSLAAFGLSTWAGNRTYTIMCVTPFLIAGVGVDDAFIMLHSWQQHCPVPCLRRRLSLVLVHIGPSISITSLTNTIAFGIGFFTPTPQMSLFCLCTSIAVFIDFVLTFTLLAPVLVLLSVHCPNNNNKASSPKQYQNGVPHSSPLPVPPPSSAAVLLSPPSMAPLLPPRNCSSSSTFSSSTPSAASAATDSCSASPIPSSTTAAPSPPPPPPRPLLAYANFLHSTRGRVCACLLLAALYAIGISGALRLKSTFEPSKAFPSDSPLAHSIHSVREVFDEFFPIHIIVNRPPDIADPLQLAEFNRMVARLEALPESWGPNRTLLWLRAYEQFDRQYHQFWSALGFGTGRSYRPSLDNLGFFLAQLQNPPTVKTEKRADGNGSGGGGGGLQLKAFQFSVVAKGMTEWWNRAVTEEKVRAVLAEYEERFNASLHDGDAAILNMLLTVKTDLIGSIAVTIVCMALVCSLFISNPAGVCAIAFCISSICFSLVGVISWCGADLDPVTMVDVLLATGFSVDYTAHVAHQYYTKRGMSSALRIAHSLHEMCPPMLQAGVSTVLCMLPLAFVPTYAIVAFAKTIFAVVSIGLLHGLFFLPALLCALPDGRNSNNGQQQQEMDDELTGKKKLAKTRRRKEEEAGQQLNGSSSGHENEEGKQLVEKQQRLNAAVVDGGLGGYLSQKEKEQQTA